MPAYLGHHDPRHACAVCYALKLNVALDAMCTEIMEEKSTVEKINKDKKDANTCMALGVGVGAIGAASAALAGAVCPLCIFIAPGLVGFGAFKRWRASHDEATHAGAMARLLG
jgi:hypothetical protein